MGTLYVIEQGARIEKHYQRLIVSKYEQQIQQVPIMYVREVVLVGNVGITTPAMQTLLSNDVGLTLMTRSGKLLGHLRAPHGGHIYLRKKQYQRDRDSAFCVDIAQSIVIGKLKNYLTVAYRIDRSYTVALNLITTIERAITQAKQPALDLATLRGIEGNGSRAYFAVLRSSLPEFMDFSKRVRSPPKDPINALLSLGYTLLTSNMIGALEIAGLDPFAGFFHSDKYGRPALALDLIEEFRAPIVDSLVMTLINKRVLNADDFETSQQGGIQLKHDALRKFFRHYNARINTQIHHPIAKRPLTYQKIFEVQARQLRKVILNELPAYKPFRIR